jgi:hypothetical protein
MCALNGGGVMTKNNDVARQLDAARDAMDRHREALSALAGTDNAADTSEEFRRQLEIARERMKKYQVVYRALAK